MTEQELKQLALDIADGKVFGSWMIPEEEQEAVLPAVFMPLAFGASQKMGEDVCSLYGYYADSKKQTVAGYPIFFNRMMVLTKSDLEILNPILEQLREMRKTFLES